MKWLLVLILTGFCSASAMTPENFMSSFQSSRIEFPADDSSFAAVNPGRYPPALIWLFQDLFSWKPLGIKEDYLRGCHPEDLYRRIVETTDAREQANRIKEHKMQCGPSFQNGSKWEWYNSIRIMSMELKIHEHSYFRRVVFSLSDGTRLKGLLALKGDNKKRPFVVVRLGIFSNVEEFLPERYLLMQMYEQGLANVLILENMSSADFIAHNRRSGMGGYEEGLQNLRVAEILRDKKEPISKLVSSLHFFGISFGGHGVLFASLLDQINKNQIDSFTGICPVVNLRDSFNSLVRPNLLGVGADFWSSLRLEGLQKKDRALADYGIPDLLKLRPVFLPRVIDFLEEEFNKNPPSTKGIKLPPEPYSNKTIWQANNFWSAYRKVDSPVLVFGTVSDSMVSPNDNVYWLDNKAADWNSDVGVVIFEYGFHCTLPIAYDWASMASLFNGRIMAYDRQTKIKERKIELTESLSADDIDAIEKSHFSIVWINDNQEVLLKFPTFSLPLPLEQLDFKFTRLGDPERTTLERWIYHNVQGQILQDGSKIKAQLKWPQVL